MPKIVSDFRVAFNEKKKPGVLQLVDVHSVTIVVGEGISSINMWNIVNR